MPSSPHTSDPVCAARATAPASSLVRWLFAALGVASFVLAIIGAVLPGLPTTVFILLGSYFLTRSCPWLEERLRALPLLRPYTKYLDPSTPMPWAVKQRVLAVMWLSIAGAVALFLWRGTVPMAVVATVLVAGLVGTVVIVRFRRAAGPAGETPGRV